MEYFVIGWMITGWVCAFASTPRWMLKDDMFGWVLLIVCGAVAGPLGIVLFFFASDNHKR